MKTHNPKPMEHCKSSAKGKVHSNTGLPQETRKKSNKWPNSTPIATRKGKWRTPGLIEGNKSLKLAQK